MSELENSQVTPETSPDASDAPETPAEATPSTPAVAVAAARPRPLPRLAAGCGGSRRRGEGSTAAAAAAERRRPCRRGCAGQDRRPGRAPRRPERAPKGDKADRKPREKRHRPAGKSVDEFVAPDSGGARPRPERDRADGDRQPGLCRRQGHRLEPGRLPRRGRRHHLLLSALLDGAGRSQGAGAVSRPELPLPRPARRGEGLTGSWSRTPPCCATSARTRPPKPAPPLTVGSTVTGKVISLTDFGAFVDLGGIEGLIHVSELKRTRVTHPNEVLKVGDEVTAKIIKLPKGGDRVSLSMKALEPDPWEGIAAQYANGNKFTGKVMRKSEFGWFIELRARSRGLLHVSRARAGMKAEDPKSSTPARSRRLGARGRVRATPHLVGAQRNAAGQPVDGVESRSTPGRQRPPARSRSTRSSVPSSCWSRA